MSISLYFDSNKGAYGAGVNDQIPITVPYQGQWSGCAMCLPYTAHFPGKLIGGISGRFYSYYNPSGLVSPHSAYQSIIADAVQSWEYSVSNCSFTYRDPLLGGTQIYFIIGVYGYAFPEGLANFYDVNDVKFAAEPTSDYKYCMLQINHTKIIDYSDFYYDSWSIQSLMAHEMGHALSLKHNPENGDISQPAISLMYASVARYTMDNIYTPQPVDYLACDALYD